MLQMWYYILSAILDGIGSKLFNIQVKQCFTVIHWNEVWQHSLLYMIWTGEGVIL